MAEDAAAPPPIRLMTFISEDQLDEAKKARGERVDDGTAERDRPLFEILRENKDKRDAEFNERFKHRPPKALDEDETEFLDRLELSRREYERQIADEEAQQLRRFQEAVEARSSAVYELKEVPSAPKVAEELKPIGRKSQPVRSLGSINITVKPQAKKAKTEQAISGKPLEGLRQSNAKVEKPSANVVIEAAGCLVSYSDESEDEDENHAVSDGNVEKPSANVVIQAACSLVSYSDENGDEDG